MVALVALLCGIGSCVDSSFPEGLPCAGSEQSCPPGQECYEVDDNDYLCYSSPELVPEMACDPVEEDDCGPGQGCYWNPPEAGGPECLPDGNVRPDDPCDEPGDCAPGFGCHEVGVEESLCQKYCEVDDSMACAPSQECMALDSEVGVCVFTSCDPLDTDMPCMPGSECYYNEMTSATECSSPGSGIQGNTCVGADDCEAGLHCFDCGGSGVCSAYCDTSRGNADCAGVPGAPTCATLEGDIGACSPCT